MSTTLLRAGVRPASAPSSSSPPARGAGGQLPQVRRTPSLDGLRALAVLAVVAFHAGAPWAPGGLLGVDVFFVLSGYLITGLLLSEHRSGGRVDLAAFWARRAGRLLPGLLLLVVAVMLVWWLAALPGGGSLRADALATLGYLANWHQAFAGQDYFSRSAAPSPLLHMWSLGVEEQFYLLWPLLVVGLLAVSRRAAWRVARRRVAALALLVAVASTVEMAVLAAGGTGASRLYYGSDTHAGALLVGAALAAVLPMTGRITPPGRMLRVLSSPAAGVVGLIGVAAAVALVPGTAPGLYRGGFLAVAAGVSLVVGACVRHPRAVLARLLALPPLAAVGRASYGVYLWHWPTVLLLDHARTGLSGPALLALRVAASMSLGLLSWWAIERHVLRATRHLRPRTVLLPAAAAVAAVVAMVVLVPVPGTAAALPPLAQLEQAQVASLPPVDRAVPVAARRPRAVLVGDSVAVTLSVGLVPAARAQGLDVVSRGALGCGIATDGAFSDGARTYPAATGCGIWPTTWGQALDKQHADVLAVLVGRWELTDRYLHGRWQHIGDPDLDAYLSAKLDAVAALAVQHRVKLALLTAPCFRGGELADGSSTVMDQPARVARWNQLLTAAVDRHPAVARLDDVGGLLCPGGSYSATVQGVVARTDDGIHLTTAGGRLVARSLVPEIIAESRPPKPRNAS